jgi:hypothetical protein
MSDGSWMRGSTSLRPRGPLAPSLSDDTSNGKTVWRRTRPRRDARVSRSAFSPEPNSSLSPSGGFSDEEPGHHERPDRPRRAPSGDVERGRSVTVGATTRTWRRYRRRRGSALPGALGRLLATVRPSASDFLATAFALVRADPRPDGSGHARTGCCGSRPPPSGSPEATRAPVVDHGNDEIGNWLTRSTA